MIRKFVGFPRIRTCRNKFLLHGRARTGRAGAFSDPPASTSFLAFGAHRSPFLHENCCECLRGYVKGPSYPPISLCSSAFLETGGAFLTLFQSFDHKRALVTNRPSLPSKYVVSKKLTLAIGWFGDYVCPSHVRALARNWRNLDTANRQDGQFTIPSKHAFLLPSLYGKIAF